MNKEVLQKLLSRMDPDDADIKIEVEAPSQQPEEDSSGNIFKNRSAFPSSNSLQWRPSFTSQRTHSPPLGILVAEAKKAQETKDNNEFEKLFYGNKKSKKEPTRKRDKLKNLQRYRQLEDPKPQVKSRLTEDEEERMRKHMLWVKKAREAAEVTERSGDCNEPKVEFERTEAREAVFTNEYIQFQQSNCSSLLRMILEQNLSSELILPEKKKVPDRFSNYEEYIRIFEFLIVNETIASLYNTYRNFKSSEGYKNPIKVSMSFHNNPTEGFEVLEMMEEAQEEGVTPHALKNLALSKYNLVLISSTPHPSLQNISCCDFGKEFLFLGCLVTPETKEDLAENVRVHTRVDKRAFHSAFDSNVHKAYVMFYDKISTFIREFLAIRHVQFDDLAEFIYNPSMMLRFKNYVLHPELFEGFFQVLEARFNKTQLNSIKELCLRDRGIIMLQGPPGTGKTSTLLGVLSGQYHYIKSQKQLGLKKILVCTPSNTAIDHIVKRIVQEGLLGGDNQVIRPKILRTGFVESKDDDIRSVYLDDICEREVLGTNKEKEVSKDTIFEINAQIKSMLRETRRMESEYRVTRSQDTYSKLRQKITERQALEHRAYELRKQRIDEKSRINEVQKRLINEAEIILTTLASTGTDRISGLKGKFNCLIVDEAGQCTEPNLMIAFQLNVPKVLLIGDPCQLPATTFSPDSNVTLYNRSLFQRMIDGGLKPYFLDIQYRMCPQIREFPSNVFYNDRLKDAPVIATRKYPATLKRGFGQKHLWFVDVKCGKEEFKDKSYMNQAEVDVVQQICERKELKGLSIGIITPYTLQKNTLKNTLKRDIFVNTIDSFQGQEKDVIIISCVRSSDVGSSKISVGFLVDERRINVALTRARFLLIVVGNAYTLGSNEIWHKFLDFAVLHKGYLSVPSLSNSYEQIKRMMKSKLVKEDVHCDNSWKKHQVLSKDFRKAEREAITLQDFEDGEVVEETKGYQKMMEEEVPKEVPKVGLSSIDEEQHLKQEWGVHQAMESTYEQVKNIYGSKSFLEILNSL